MCSKDLFIAKRFMQQYEEVALFALGMTISSVVTVVEILKNNGLVIVKKIYTSTIDIGDEMRGRMVQKPKMEIKLKKSDNFDEIMAAATHEENGTNDQYEQ